MNSIINVAKIVSILALVMLATAVPIEVPKIIRAPERTERQKFFCKWTKKFLCRDAHPLLGYDYDICITNALVFDDDNCGFHPFEEYNPCVASCNKTGLSAKCVQECVFGQPLAFSDTNWTNDMDLLVSKRLIIHTLCFAIQMLWWFILALGSIASSKWAFRMNSLCIAENLDGNSLSGSPALRVVTFIEILCNRVKNNPFHVIQNVLLSKPPWRLWRDRCKASPAGPDHQRSPFPLTKF